MKALTYILIVLFTSVGTAQNINFTVTSSTMLFSITCINSQVTLVATSNYSLPVNYAWTGTNFSTSGATVAITNPGNYIVIASSGTLSTTQTISIATNTVFPICIANSTFQVSNATVTAVPFTWTVTNLTNNLVHYTYYPLGFTIPPYVNPGVFSIFSAGPLGTYTHCAINVENGCATCLPFILSLTGPVIPTTTTSIGENNPGSNLDEKPSIFPNPNNGSFRIDAKNSSIKSIEVYNNLGTLVQSAQGSDSHRFNNIQNEPPGIYIIKIIQENGRSSFIKMLME